VHSFRHGQSPWHPIGTFGFPLSAFRFPEELLVGLASLDPPYMGHFTMRISYRGPFNSGSRPGVGRDSSTARSPPP
jgi:hypothetical protein